MSNQQGYLSRIKGRIIRGLGGVEPQSAVQESSPPEQFEYLRVPAMAMPTIPEDQFLHVKTGWDYVRHAMLGLASHRILLDSIPGDFAEAGVWRGDCARFLHRFAPDRDLYLFDTFEGFLNEKDTRFQDTTVEHVVENVGEPHHTVHIRKGYFPESAVGLEGNTFALVSLDLDTFEGILAGWEFFAQE